MISSKKNIVIGLILFFLIEFVTYSLEHFVGIILILLKCDQFILAVSKGIIYLIILIIVYKGLEENYLNRMNFNKKIIGVLIILYIIRVFLSYYYNSIYPVITEGEKLFEVTSVNNSISFVYKIILMSIFIIHLYKTEE
jgi:hypothetical protein